LDLRIKDLFAKLRIHSHLTTAGIRKCESYSPLHLLFVLTKVAFLHIATVHNLLSRPLKSFSLAQKDTFQRFKKAGWSWGALYRCFIRFWGRRSGWFKYTQDNCLVLDTTILPKWGQNLENLTWVYDHCRGKTVKGYELLPLALGQEHGHSFAAQVFSVFQTFSRFILLAYLLEKEDSRPTMGDVFRQLEEATGKLTFLERLQQYLTAFLRKIFDTLADFYDPSPSSRAYLCAITN
jgi:hypothetical protein